MFIGHLNVDIFIPHSQSLKDRRQVVGRVKQRVRNNFNISVAEHPSDKWQRCELSFVCVNSTKKYIDNVLDQVESFIRFNHDFHILNVEKEII